MIEFEYQGCRNHNNVIAINTRAFGKNKNGFYFFENRIRRKSSTMWINVTPYCHKKFAKLLRRFLDQKPDEIITYKEING